MSSPTRFSFSFVAVAVDHAVVDSDLVVVPNSERLVGSEIFLVSS